MNYNLAENKGTSSNALLAVAKKFVPFIRGEKKGMIIALIAIVLNSGLNLAAPIIVGHVVGQFTAAALNIGRNDVTDRTIGESHWIVLSRCD